jgi:hypothetical protein
MQVKQSVLQWAVAKDVAGQQLPPFIKNKLAHVLVTIAQVRGDSRCNQQC